MYTRVIACSVLVLAGMISLFRVPAAAFITIRVTPAVLSLEGEPGAIGTQMIAVANEGDEAAEIVSAVEPYQSATGENSATGWISVEPAEFSLGPGETRDITVSLTIPPDSASGGRYALVSFSTGAQDSAEGPSAIGGKVGVAVLLAVRGNEPLVEAAQLVEFGPVLEPDGRLGFRVLVSNTGNLHVRPFGLVSVMTEQEIPYGTLEIAPQRNILPGNESLLLTTGSLPVDFESKYSAQVELAIGANISVTAETDISPTIDLNIESLSVCENLDRGPTVTTHLRNDGGLGMLPSIRYEIFLEDGTFIEDTPLQGPLLIWGGATLGSSATVTTRLGSGRYVAVAQVLPVPPTSDGQVLLEPLRFEHPFVIGGLDGNAVPVCETSPNGS